MKVSIHILLAFLSSFIVGCASTEKKTVLEERAGYGFTPPPMNMSGSGSVKYVPTRVPEKVIVAWLHAKELPSKDYFWGAWLSIVAAPESWEMKKVETPRKETKTNKRTSERPIKSPPKNKRP